MTKSFTASAIAILALIGVGSATAQQFGTADDARAMLDRAITALKTDEATALKEINDANNKEFHDRDLYVSCFNTLDGKFTASPSPGMIGMDVRTFTFDNDPIGLRAYDALQGIPEGTLATMDFKFSKGESLQRSNQLRSVSATKAVWPITNSRPTYVPAPAGRYPLEQQDASPLTSATTPVRSNPG